MTTTKTPGPKPERPKIPWVRLHTQNITNDPVPNLVVFVTPKGWILSTRKGLTYVPDPNHDWGRVEPALADLLARTKAHWSAGPAAPRFGDAK